ncbi:hypothetical protein KFL_012340010, partial [Klebsormidium nitens]
MSKVTGYKDKVIGASKEAVGSIASERLRTEGEAQRFQGHTAIDQAKVQNRAQAIGDKISGAFKEGTGTLTGDASLRQE